LLHPPLLDEAGFASAAQWYVEGFAQRSGTQVRLEPPKHLGRMPGAVEITLFRILQESLTNVHRHSRSSKVDIQVDGSDHIVVMMIKDFGCGIPADVLGRFQTSLETTSAWVLSVCENGCMNSAVNSTFSQVRRARL